MLSRESIKELLTQITGDLVNYLKIPLQKAHHPGDMERHGVDVFRSHFSHVTRDDIVDLFEASKSAGLTMTRANDFLLPAIIIVSDQNRDGSISLNELHDVMAMYNWIPDDISKTELDQLMRDTYATLDVNKDGVISPKELLFGIMKKIHIERKFYNN